MEHPEGKAIAAVVEIFEPLNDSQRAALIAYLVQRFSLHGHLSTGPAPVDRPGGGSRKLKRPTKKRKPSEITRAAKTSEIDIAAIVNEFKGLDEYDALQEAILDKSDALKRVLLALALYRRVHKDTEGMTSGEIARFYSQLGVTMRLPLISTTLSGRAKQFVMTDQERSKGAIMRYRLSRQGIKKAAELGVPEG